MKFVGFGPPGAERPAHLGEDGSWCDLSNLCGDLVGPVLDDLGRFAALDISTLPQVSGAPRQGPGSSGTGKFRCTVLDYAGHAAEGGLDVPPKPILFMKATSAICGPTDPIIIPRGSARTSPPAGCPQPGPVRRRSSAR